MKKLVSMVMGLAAAVAFAIQMPQVQVLTFAVTGSETYADGSELQDGECYALVWSSDGEFEGIAPNGTAKDPDDKVLYIGTIQKDRQVVFQIGDGVTTAGRYDIWILDTRIFVDGKVDKVGKSAGGKVTITHAAKATTASVAASGSGSLTPTALPTVPGGVVVSGKTVAPGEVPAFKFTSIRLDGDYVVMEAENTVPGVNYATVADGKETGVTTATSDKITLIRPKTGDSAIIRGITK